MRVWITALLVGIAVLIGTLVSKDPGYVLIAYGPYQLQTSVWMMLALVIAAWLLDGLWSRSFAKRLVSGSIGKNGRRAASD